MNDFSKIKIKLTHVEEIRISTLGSDFRKDVDFICSVIKDEEDYIFEHSSYHVLSYINYNSEIFGVEGKFGKILLVLDNERGVYFFYPNIKDFDQFIKFARQILPDEQVIRIKYITKDWILTHKNNLIKYKYIIYPRSENEVIYDTKLLSDLSGVDFSKLRNKRNKLIKKRRLCFSSINNKNKYLAHEVLMRWQETQGHKYSRNKFYKESYMVDCFAKFAEIDKEFHFYVGLTRSKPLSIACFYRNEFDPTLGTISIIKGINRPTDGGINGVSDATYSFVFFQAHCMGIKYLNDGELGQEEGTREHKLNFKPLRYLKSFDLEMRLTE